MYIGNFSARSLGVFCSAAVAVVVFCFVFIFLVIHSQIKLETMWYNGCVHRFLVEFQES